MPHVTLVIIDGKIVLSWSKMSQQMPLFTGGRSFRVRWPIGQ